MLGWRCRARRLAGTCAAGRVREVLADCPSWFAGPGLDAVCGLRRQHAPAGGNADADHASRPEPASPGEMAAEDVLWLALAMAPREDIPVADLVAATGMSHRWVNYRLRALADAAACAGRRAASAALACNP